MLIWLLLVVLSFRALIYQGRLLLHPLSLKVLLLLLLLTK
jgi:hypothetical protein